MPNWLGKWLPEGGLAVTASFAANGHILLILDLIAQILFCRPARIEAPPMPFGHQNSGNKNQKITQELSIRMRSKYWSICFDEFARMLALFARMHLAGFVDSVPRLVWDHMEEMTIWDARVQCEFVSHCGAKGAAFYYDIGEYEAINLGGANDKLDTTPTTPPNHESITNMMPA